MPSLSFNIYKKDNGERLDTRGRSPQHSHGKLDLLDRTSQEDHDAVLWS